MLIFWNINYFERMLLSLKYIYSLQIILAVLQHYCCASVSEKIIFQYETMDLRNF